MARRNARRKTHRLSLRLSGDDVATIDRAARLRGCSRAAFVRAAAGFAG